MCVVFVCECCEAWTNPSAGVAAGADSSDARIKCVKLVDSWMGRVGHVSFHSLHKAVYFVGGF